MTPHPATASPLIIEAYLRGERDGEVRLDCLDPEMPIAAVYEDLARPIAGRPIRG